MFPLGTSAPTGLKNLEDRNIIYDTDESQAPAANISAISALISL